MLLPYAFMRSTRRQNETKVLQFREHQDITFHSSTLHLHYTCTQPWGHPIQSLPHPQSRHQTGFGHTNRTGFSMWLYNPAAQFLLLCLSQPFTAHSRFSCAALSEAQPCPSTGQLAKSIVLRTTSKVSCSQESSCLATAPLGNLGTCPKFGTCGTDTVMGNYAWQAISPIRTGSHPVWEKILSKQWLTSSKYVRKALKNHYKN